MAGSDPHTAELSPDAARSPRNTRMHALFDARQGRGLEVGPLHMPVVTREHGDVRYVDVHDRARLQQTYSEHEGFPVELIEEPDFVLLGSDDAARPLPQAVAPAAPYDWVVASHVIEHVPDVVTWLSEVAQVLVDDGELVLAIPDRRFCFDVDREPTTVGEMLLAQASADSRPNLRAVYDHYSRCMHIDTERVWNGGAAGPRMYGLDVVRAKMEAAAGGTYVDVHVWVWTPASFVAQLAELAGLDLLDFVVEQVVDTAHGDLEFYARLRRLPRALDAPGRAVRRARGLQTWTDVEPAAAAPPPAPAGGNDAVLRSLSQAETRLVLAKRRWLFQARRRLPFLHP
jgi:SAM-dependent methyltransferase